MAIPHPRTALYVRVHVPLQDNRARRRAARREHDVRDLEDAPRARFTRAHDDARAAHVRERGAAAEDDAPRLPDELRPRGDAQRVRHVVRAVVEEDDLLPCVLYGLR